MSNRLGERAILHKRLINPPQILFISIILLLAISAFQRGGLYNDQFRLWSDTVKKSPSKPRPHNNLAAAFKIKKMFDLALKEYVETIRLNPIYVPGHGNLASLYYEMDKLDEAETELKVALNYDSPFKGVLHKQLGFVYVKKWMPDEAIKEFGKAIALLPNSPQARQDNAIIFTNEAFSYADKYDFQRALLLHRVALLADPFYPDAHFGLGQAYEAVGQKEYAINHWEEYLRLAPADEPFRKDAMMHLKRLK